ncbi:helix-turn-helix transcriptional regulator [Altererythrobacter arenosus]|uniref:Helix-turn-helix transcriptional regulator n=1 Tax=Altererythrobacter arenosus TaxID=3032592 RepID=A0ABY8FVS3_9SPHN|nr:helix-turn-helix transcriptional regulator [Altererythrobacter sp. CAU 1644]WFL77506.1 helix-turn-helix transcriptional regulator [Altererythrobacter sp. CAU 1644]
MINRIRDIRKQKGMTLAELAEKCVPPTTAQTIGRLETGMRNLSIKWMDRIGAALEVDPELLVRSDESEQPMVVAALRTHGPEALTKQREALVPTELAGDGALLVLAVEESVGEFRPDDMIWLRQISPEDAPKAINRDVLIPRPGGRFYFGRLIDRQGDFIGVLPPGSGQKQQVVEGPPWIAVAEMLVRKL